MAKGARQRRAPISNKYAFNAFIIMEEESVPMGKRGAFTWKYRRQSGADS